MDLGTAVLEDAGDGGEGCEGIGGHFGFGLGDFGEEGRFTDGGEADEGYSGVAGLADVETGATTTAGARAGFEELCAETGEFTGDGVSM